MARSWQRRQSRVGRLRPAGVAGAVDVTEGEVGLESVEVTLPLGEVYAKTDGLPLDEG